MREQTGLDGGLEVEKGPVQQPETLPPCTPAAEAPGEAI